jgi:hypothetical protein
VIDGMKPADRQRLSQLLLAFGGIGLVLILATAALVAILLGQLDAAASSLSKGQAQLTAMLEPASSSLHDAATAAGHAGASLSASEAAARDGATLTVQMAVAMDQMHALASVDILGARPFGAAAASFSELATRSRSLSASLTTTADSLAADTTDSAAVSADLDRLASQLDALRAGTETAAPTDLDAGIGLLRIVLLGLLGWLAVPAIASLWLGRRLRTQNQD